MAPWDVLRVRYALASCIALMACATRPTGDAGEAGTSGESSSESSAGDEDTTTEVTGDGDTGDGNGDTGDGDGDGDTGDGDGDTGDGDGDGDGGNNHGWQDEHLLEMATGHAGPSGLVAGSPLLAWWLQVNTSGVRRLNTATHGPENDSWSEALPVSSDADDVNLVSMVAGPAPDRASVAWVQQSESLGDEIYFSRSNEDASAWMAPELLAQDGLNHSELEALATEDGHSVVAWIAYTPIGAITKYYLRARHHDGNAWSEAQALEINDAWSRSLALAHTATSEVAAAWSGRNLSNQDAIVLRTLDVDSGQWGEASFLDAPQAAPVRDLQWARSGGRDWLVFTAENADGRRDVVAYRRLNGGAWSPPIVVDDAEGTVDELQVVIDAEGSVWFAWIQDAGSELWHLKTRRFISDADIFDPVATVAESPLVDDPISFDLSVDGSELPVIVWLLAPEGASEDLWVRQQLDGLGTWDAPFSLESADGDADFASIAPMGPYECMVIWDQADSEDVDQVWARRFGLP